MYEAQAYSAILGAWMTLATRRNAREAAEFLLKRASIDWRVRVYHKGAEVINPFA
jgi:hypothetical protein